MGHDLHNGRWQAPFSEASTCPTGGKSTRVATHGQLYSDEELSKINDDMPDPEPEVPDESSLEPSEYQKQLAVVKVEGEALLFKLKQIRHWLQYQYSKMHNLSMKETGKDNPYRIMLHRLAGLSVSKPRKAQAFSLWAKVNSVTVQTAWNEELKKKAVPLSERAAKLNTFKSKLFKLKLKETQNEWLVTAEEEHEEALKEYNEKMESSVSKDPGEMQRCLENLSSMMQPFIEMVMEATGCPVTCIVGGPQPADRGCLDVSS
ncbi:uncharacterized protein ARMOST_02954 [Armillaria ostoyae]|uniref:Uncharacterized protein n=1 Tax=Armillaria ostoyae TaxID=47428 RepID=A0A284QT46_ARMOS|nr:uncharacterized protein ARMOST_02954 [Armillaria ostoyae]